MAYRLFLYRRRTRFPDKGSIDSPRCPWFRSLPGRFGARFLKMVIRYNAPVSPTFSLISLAALVLGFLTAGLSTDLVFSVHSSMRADDILAWLRLFTHVLGHANWEHL